MKIGMNEMATVNVKVTYVMRNLDGVDIMLSRAFVEVCEVARGACMPERSGGRRGEGCVDVDVNVNEARRIVDGVGRACQPKSGRCVEPMKCNGRAHRQARVRVMDMACAGHGGLELGNLRK